MVLDFGTVRHRLNSNRDFLLFFSLFFIDVQNIFFVNSFFHCFYVPLNIHDGIDLFFLSLSIIINITHIWMKTRQSWPKSVKLLMLKVIWKQKKNEMNEIKINFVSNFNFISFFTIKARVFFFPINGKLRKMCARKMIFF